MDGIIDYIKKAVILFLLLTLLIELIPRGSYRKYIQFFARIILVFGLLSPLLSFRGKDADILAAVNYETFWQNMEEVKQDAKKIAYEDPSYYQKKIEDAVKENITQITEAYNYTVKEISVVMTQDYQIDRIYMRIVNPAKENIVIGKVTLEDTAVEKEQKKAEEEAAYRKLKETLISYYQLTEEQLEIVCD